MTSQLQAARTQQSGRTSRYRGRIDELRLLGAVALGGALGSPARYGLAQLIPADKGAFPWSTLAINLTGCLVLGGALTLLLERFPPTRHLRAFVATGFLGAYTTYSTFAVETVLLTRDGHVLTAAVYSALSLLAGLVAIWLGMALARRLPHPTRGQL